MIQAWLTYLVEVSVCSLLLYSVYWFFLRKETFHHLNRAYLISTMCLSFAIPLVKISVPIYFTADSTQNYTINPEKTIASTTTANDADRATTEERNIGIQHNVNSTIEKHDTKANLYLHQKWLLGLMCVYLTGVIGLALRLLVQLARITRLITKADRTVIDGFQIINISQDINPCCFGNMILINRKDVSEDDLAEIIRHEKVHIKQCHSIDNVLFQILTIALWFNPVAWLYKNALRMTHEYLADTTACCHCYHSSYQKLLLRQLISSTYFELVHDFNLCPIRERIAMMSRARSARHAGLKVLWALPVIAALLIVFAIRFETVQAREVHLCSTAEISTMTSPVNVPERVVLADMENIFKDILKEMERKDFMWRSYIYMRLACMRAAGWEDIDYATLMPLSGYGLTFSYEANEQSGAHFYRPAGTDERIARATGFGWEWLYFDDIEKYWQALKQTIDSGRPVHAPHMEEVLFVGYQEAAEKKNRKVRPLAIPVFVDPDSWWSWNQFEKWFREFGGPLGRFSGKQETISARDAAIEVMRALVTFAHEDSRSKDPDFGRVRWGLDGIEAFTSDMADLSKKERHFCSGWFGCHDSNPQTMSRQLTGRYLSQTANLFDNPVATLMQEAARKYQSAHRAWLKWDRHLGRFAPYNGWRSKKHRLAGAEAAREALQHERRAIEKITEALSLLSS